MAKTVGKKVNYINPDVFNEGIDKKIVQNNKLYLVLYEKESGNILAASTVLKGKITWRKNGDTGLESYGGGDIIISTIPAIETLSYVKGPDQPANMFALVEFNASKDGNSEIVNDAGIRGPDKQYPDLDSNSIVYIAGNLSSATTISEKTNFQFNESTISFQVQ